MPWIYTSKEGISLLKNELYTRLSVCLNHSHACDFANAHLLLPLKVGSLVDRRCR